MLTGRNDVVLAIDFKACITCRNYNGSGIAYRPPGMIEFTTDNPDSVNAYCSYFMNTVGMYSGCHEWSPRYTK